MLAVQARLKTSLKRARDYTQKRHQGRNISDDGEVESVLRAQPRGLNRRLSPPARAAFLLCSQCLSPVSISEEQQDWCRGSVSHPHVVDGVYEEKELIHTL